MKNVFKLLKKKNSKKCKLRHNMITPKKAARNCTYGVSSIETHIKITISKKQAAITIKKVLKN